LVFSYYCYGSSFALLELELVETELVDGVGSGVGNGGGPACSRPTTIHTNTNNSKQTGFFMQLFCLNSSVSILTNIRSERYLCQGARREAYHM
jgi:hypothetical protein